jgi:hypothetical protein
LRKMAWNADLLQKIPRGRGPPIHTMLGYWKAKSRD